MLVVRMHNWKLKSKALSLQTGDSERQLYFHVRSNNEINFATYGVIEQPSSGPFLERLEKDARNIFCPNSRGPAYHNW